MSSFHKTVAVLGTLDSKGEEHAFVANVAFLFILLLQHVVVSNALIARVARVDRPLSNSSAQHLLVCMLIELNLV